jgi:LuxR family maltose regulon positive regulatory protein
LQAQALAILQHEADALQLLADLLLAEGELALRATYLEEGPQLIGLLQRLRQVGHANPTQTPRLLALLNLVLGEEACSADTQPQTTNAASEPAALAAPASSSTPDAPAAAPVIDCGLSPRELQILQCLSAGMPNKLIANSLHISEPTVKFHLRNINHKLDARNRTHAVFIARERGWVS